MCMLPALILWVCACMSYMRVCFVSLNTVVATGAWVKSKHDLYLIRGSVGA